MTVSNSVLAGAAHTRDGRTPLNTRPAQREPVRDHWAPAEVFLKFCGGAGLQRSLANDAGAAAETRNIPTNPGLGLLQPGGLGLLGMYLNPVKEVNACNCHVPAPGNLKWLPGAVFTMIPPHSIVPDFWEVFEIAFPIAVAVFALGVIGHAVYEHHARRRIR
jgi:hypothetical protein